MKKNKLLKALYSIIFVVTFSTIIIELLLTRIFSVVAWYHFAFMAISTALLGMSAGAVYVYLNPNKFSEEKIEKELSNNLLLFGLSILILIVLLLGVPFIPGTSTLNIASMIVTFIGISVPFFYSGVLVSLILTKFIEKISILYFLDLIGAGLGCLLFIPLLANLDPITILLILSSLILLFTLFIKATSKFKIIMVSMLIIFNILLAFMNLKTEFLRISWVRGHIEQKPEYEKWNAFSRIIVKNYKREPFGWGLSNKYLKNKRIEQKLLVIDSSAGTVLTRFNKNFKDIEYLKWDIINIAHYLRPDSKVYVIGVGGGRDILSALLFKQKRIVGVEINNNIINALTNNYSNFTGHLNNYSNVSLINDEARSYIARQKDSFDIIQSSLIDTYAASSSGAFALTENSLYTVEAWKTFIKHLSERGILTFSRWWRTKLDGEMIRMTSLAATTLRSMDIKDVNKHIILLRHKLIGTILVSKNPFSTEDENIIRNICKEFGFQYVLGPNQSQINFYKKILDNDFDKSVEKKLPITLIAPTDNNPFFFQILKFSHIFSWNKAKQFETNANVTAVFVLFISFIIVTILTLVMIIIPLLLTKKRLTNKKAVLWGMSFFSSIGMAFMLIEISQLNSFSIFIGHPTYGLSVVLFSLLISSGLGSYTTNKISFNKDSNTSDKKGFTIMYLIVIMTLIYSFVSPLLQNIFRASITPIRILVSVIMIFPIGFFMGMAFPIGMKVSKLIKNSPTAWFWGINGAMSVLSSVLAIMLSIMLGISITTFIGVFFYLLAAVSLKIFLKASR